MTVEEKMYDIMKNKAGITALVPASRIKGWGVYQNLARPYIFHMPVALEPSRTHEGLVGLRIWRFYQISIFADTLLEAANIREALITELDGYHDAAVNRIAFLGPGGPGDFDTDKGIAHLPLNFEVAEGLAA